MRESPARSRPDGELIPLLEQNRSLWDRAAIAEGVALVTETLSGGSVGAYQLQAAGAAVHDEAATADDPAAGRAAVRGCRMSVHSVSIDDLTKQLVALRVRPGGVLLVHTSFRAVRPVEAGPLGLIAALRRALGPEGTLVMPTMTDGETVFDPRLRRSRRGAERAVRRAHGRTMVWRRGSDRR